MFLVLTATETFVKLRDTAEKVIVASPGLRAFRLSQDSTPVPSNVKARLEIFFPCLSIYSLLTFRLSCFFL